MPTRPKGVVSVWHDDMRQDTEGYLNKMIQDQDAIVTRTATGPHTAGSVTKVNPFGGSSIPE